MTKGAVHADPYTIACARSSTLDAISSPGGKIFLKTNASSSISCRVRGVEGSCAKRLTIEFYTVVMLAAMLHHRLAR